MTRLFRLKHRFTVLSCGKSLYYLPRLMGTNRIEAFSDGVIAVIITIMVLELRVPSDPSRAALIQQTPVFCSYALSFIMVAILWVNHHHLLHVAKRASGRLLWGNNNLLFWMSLIPFVTAYMGRNHTAPFAVAMYGTVMALTAAAFTLLRWIVARDDLDDSAMTAHHNRMHRKNILSIATYTAAVGLAFISVYLSFCIFVLIPIMYFIPERKLAEH
jgi:uncharacterized membrane protein